MRHVALFWGLFLFSNTSWAFNHHTSHIQKIGTSIVGYLLYKPADYNQNANTYPLIIFLHGAGERASGNVAKLDLVDNTALPQLIEQGMSLPFIVVSPQASYSWNGTQASVDALIELIANTHRVDRNRIYITGLSDGGKGVFDYTGNYSHKIAAFIPVSTWPSSLPESSYINNPMWAFMGSSDTYGGLSNFNKNLKKIGGVSDFELLSGGHSSSVWNTVYQKNNKFIFNTNAESNIYDWMLRYSLNGVSPQPVNQAPIVNAGSDQSITLPVNELSLIGSASDSDGNIATYTWSKVSGGSVILTNTNQPNLNLSNLAQGNYIFKLVAADNLGATAEDLVSVTVNPEPVSPPPPPPNPGEPSLISINKPTLASSVYSADYKTTSTVDGVIDSTQNFSWWASASAKDQWLEVQLQNNFFVSKVKVHLGKPLAFDSSGSTIATRFQIQALVAGNWQILADITGNTQREREFEVSVQTDKVRFVCPDFGFCRLREIEIYETLVAPPAPPAAPAEPAKIQLSSANVISGGGNKEALLDEQSLAGNPKDETGGQPVNAWFVGWNPAYEAVIDLGAVYQVTDIYLFDTNGTCDGQTIDFYAGDNSSWTMITQQSLELYNRWRAKPVSAQTRYVKIVQNTKCKFSEVVFYGSILN